MYECVCACISKCAFGCYLYHVYVNISRTDIVRCTCDISSSLKSHSIYASRIYLSIYFYTYVYVCPAAYVLVYGDEHLQLAQKVIDFWRCAQSGNNGNGMEFSEENELKCLEERRGSEEEFLNSAKLNRNIRMPYI